VHTIHHLPFKEALAVAAKFLEARPGEIDFKESDLVKVIAIDGPAGAGKTTLAHGMSEILGGAPVVHMDDLYLGWEDALTSSLTKTLRDHILTPISLGKRGSYRRWDWQKSQLAEVVDIPRHPYLILEGVGAGQRVVRAFSALLIWIDISAETGLNRVIARDEALVEDLDKFQEEMRNWQAREILHFAEENTFDTAQLRFNGSLFTR
jgi:uridine kinase